MSVGSASSQRSGSGPCGPGIAPAHRVRRLTLTAHRDNVSGSALRLHAARASGTGRPHRPRGRRWRHRPGATGRPTETPNRAYMCAHARPVGLVQCNRDRHRGGRRRRADQLAAGSTARLTGFKKRKPRHRQRGSLRLTGSAAKQRADKVRNLSEAGRHTVASLLDDIQDPEVAVELVETKLLLNTSKVEPYLNTSKVEPYSCA